MKRFFTFGFLGTLSVVVTAALLINVADNNIIPGIFDIAAEETLSQVLNITFAAVAVLSLLAAIGFGLEIERQDWDSLRAMDVDIEEQTPQGLCYSIPVLNLILGPIYNAIKPLHDLEKKDFREHVAICNLGGLVIAGGVLAIVFAEEIHQYFLTNTDLPAELSKGLANILAPEHILGMAISAIALVSLPLIHSMVTCHKLDISCAKPKDSWLVAVFSDNKYELV